MYTLNKLLVLVIIAISISTSCSKDPLAEHPNDTIYAIRSIFGYGKTHAKYIYTSTGKIAEYQSFYFYSRFIYDDTGRLVKQETAADPDLYSSQSHEKSELMTSENSTFTNYSIYEYNEEGKLKSIKNYAKKNSIFEYTSMNSFEYQFDNIVKLNLHNAENVITQFYTYEYDANRNVVKERNFSHLGNAGSDPKLVNETSYKFDTKNNPFKIYKELGQPGLYSNTNNIVESNSVFPFGDETDTGNYFTSKTNFTYNINGFPVMVTAENSVYKYIY